MSQDTTKVLITAWFSDDEEARKHYIPTSEKIFKAHGMINATAYGGQETIAGDLLPHAVVMLEWNNAEQCLEAFNSPEYQALLDSRSKAFTKLDITLLAPRG